MKRSTGWGHVLPVMMLVSAFTAAGCRETGQAIGATGRVIGKGFSDLGKGVSEGFGNGGNGGGEGAGLVGLALVGAALGADDDVVAALLVAGFAAMAFEEHQASLEQKKKAQDNFQKYVKEDDKLTEEKRKELADNDKKIAIKVGEKKVKDEQTQKEKVVQEYIVTDPVTGEPENDKVYTVEETAVKDNKYTGKVDNMDVVFVDTIE